MIDSRASGGGTTIRRRRECTGCAHRYTTYEEIERPRLMIVKRDGRSEELSRVKLTASILKACQKRPNHSGNHHSLVEKVIEDLCHQFDREVPSGAVGTRVMEGLRADSTRWPTSAMRALPAVRRSHRFRDRKSKNWRNPMILLRPDCLVFKTPLARNSLLATLSDGGVDRRLRGMAPTRNWSNTLRKPCCIISSRRKVRNRWVRAEFSEALGARVCVGWAST